MTRHQFHVNAVVSRLRASRTFGSLVSSFFIVPFTGRSFARHAKQTQDHVRRARHHLATNVYVIKVVNGHTRASPDRSVKQLHLSISFTLFNATSFLRHGKVTPGRHFYAGRSQTLTQSSLTTNTTITLISLTTSTTTTSLATTTTTTSSSSTG